MKTFLFTVLCGMLLAGQAMAQAVNTLPQVLDSKVKSVQIAPSSNLYLPPIYVMGSDDVLNITFDYLDYDVHYLRYSVRHCNANWQPSVLVPSEYVSGFNEADITDYAQSNSTFVHYYNYNFTLPNADMQFYKSGNYLLTVYEQDNPEKVLFQARLAVCENTVAVHVDATSRTDVDYNDRHQQVSFTVDYKQGLIADPYNELTAVVSQNSRLDNEVYLTRPFMVSPGQVTYDHYRSLIFPAGNEYRRIETVNLHSLNMGVERVQYFEPYYHATLRVDEARAASPYLYDKTQHGHFTIRNAESDYSATESDYLVTHFSLDCDRMTGGKIYVQGAFTQGLPAADCEMHYDQPSGTYTCDMLLKQGAYNYQYLWVPNGSSVGQTGPIEGDKYQTTNEYLVKIYDRPSGERYDRLIGYSGDRFGDVAAGLWHQLWRQVMLAIGLAGSINAAASRPCSPHRPARISRPRCDRSVSCQRCR